MDTVHNYRVENGAVIEAVPTPLRSENAAMVAGTQRNSPSLAEAAAASIGVVIATATDLADAVRDLVVLQGG